MVRIISQETYDEVVNENIEQFEMTPEEAIDDAIKQFQAQGVDLSCIIKDLVLHNDNDSIVTYLNEIECCMEHKNYENLSRTLNTLGTEFDKDIACRVFAGKHNGYNILIKLIEESLNNDTILKLALKTITSLMTGYPDLLTEEGIALQMQILDKPHDSSRLHHVSNWIKECCIKHELNRQSIFNRGIFEKLKKMLVSEDVSGSEVQDISSVLRSLVLEDDIRHEHGKAHEHATHIAKGALNVLTSLLFKFEENKAVVGELMLTLASLIVRNEFCQIVEDARGLKFILNVMINHPDSENLNRQALKLLKALAGNDNVKSHIVTSGCTPLIVSVITRFNTCEALVTAALACITALTLRSFSNAGVFYDCGAPSVIVNAMKNFPNNDKVLRQACWAIRNMSVRNKLESKEFIAYGVEDVLHNVLRVHGSLLENDAKAALRDLGLNVELKERWTGKGFSLSNADK